MVLAFLAWWLRLARAAVAAGRQVGQNLARRDIDVNVAPQLLQVS
jgi:hypothetical protein